MAKKVTKTGQSLNLSTDIFKTLKDRIIVFQYPPGYRFTEEALCAEFGVSRSPVREALRMLVENDLVDKTPYKGYSVKQLDLKEIHELYDLRLALETFVVERLAQRGISGKDLQPLIEIWKKLRKAELTDSSIFSVKDEEFHETLAALLGNQSLLQQIRSIDEKLHFIRMSDITTIARLRTTCEQHLRILDCLKEEDVQGAREAMLVNIEAGRKNVDHAIKEALAKAYLKSQASA